MGRSGKGEEGRVNFPNRNLQLVWGENVAVAQIEKRSGVISGRSRSGNVGERQSPALTSSSCDTGPSKYDTLNSGWG